MKDIDEAVRFINSKNAVEDFIRFAERHNVKRRNLLIRKSYKRLERTVTANIIYDAFDMNEFVQYINRKDNIVNAAIEVIESGKVYPQRPEQEQSTGE